MNSLQGPSTLPLKQLYQWIFNPLNYLEENAKHYKDYFIGSFKSDFKFVFIHNPSAIEEIFTADLKQFDSGKTNRYLANLLGNNSLLVLDGPRHRKHRQLLMPNFHGDRVNKYKEIICEITNRVINSWQDGQKILVRKEMQEISFEVILQAVFGLEQSPRGEKIKIELLKWQDMFSSRLGTFMTFMPELQRDFGPLRIGQYYSKQKMVVDELLYKQIDEKRRTANGAQVDILSLLIEAYDAKGKGMSDAELRDELVTLLLAGHETTATAISWALYRICQTPEVKQKLYDELKQNNEDAFQNINQLPYLNAVCLETLRLHPVVLITTGRLLKFPFEIMNYTFDKGMILAPCMYLLHRREDLYPNPHQFRPERFLERQYSPYEYMPFGGSNRRCIGSALALLEMKIVLAKVCLDFDLKGVNSNILKGNRRGITVAPTKLKMIVRKSSR
jgi:cytochrome P450 family 110